MLAVPSASGSAQSAAKQQDAPSVLHTDSRAPYVHRITLYDHDGEVISPDDEPAPPYSPMRTCGKCHPVGEISHGWHFNAGLKGADGRAVEQRRNGEPWIYQGRNGEPWIYVDTATGTQIPLSARGWAGTFKPADVGLSDWELVKRFGRHMPGGGTGDPASKSIGESDEALRWAISGPLQIDCMFCHSADQTHDPAEAERQIEKENFRWIATAALGLGVVRGEARKLPDDFDPLQPPDPDYPQRALPAVVYDKSRFDADERVFFNVTRRMPVGRCYFCHSFRQVGSPGPAAWHSDRDIHLTAGMICTDCHRNGIDHMIVRGYDGETAAAGNAAAQTLTCRGCHLGNADLLDGPDGKAGRLGAPYPLHKGMPLLHFRELSCTACHSGPWPQDAAVRFQTSMNHGLGVPTRARGAHDPPTIVAPIFVSNADGAIEPRRMMWPAYWGVLIGETVKPLPLDLVKSAAAKLAARSKPRAGEHPGPLAEGDMTALLTQLAALAGEEGAIVYLRNGVVHQLTSEGKLSAAPHAAARPYHWPLTHDVRPASQSLGIRGCTDCHSENAPIFSGKLAAADEQGSEGRPMQTMTDLRGEDSSSMRVLGLMFRLRPAFKLFGFACAFVLAVVLIRHAGAGLERVLNRKT